MEESSLNNNLNKKKSISKNYIYNLIYQFFLLVIPLVVTPYVARVLGSDGTGRYTFCFSIVTYFTLFASLGFEKYGQREIARNQNDKEKQTCIFWEIVISKVVISCLVLLIYVLFCLFGIFGQDNYSLMLVMSINIISVLLDISFYFQGNENFGRMVISNIIVKSIGILLILFFVKEKNTLWLYTFIQSIIILASTAVLWAHVPDSVFKVDVKKIKPFRHIKPSLLLFLPTMAISVYTALDKTLIGLMIPGEIINTLEDGTQVITKIADIENGNYEYAEKLVKMSLTVITSLGVVMIPRNSRLLNDNRYTDVQNNILKSVQFVFFLGMPIMLGCITIANVFIPWYLGDGYDKAVFLFKILSPLILIIGLSNVFGLQYLVPAGKDKQFTIAIIAGAIVNVLLNIILIPVFYSYGAAIATIIAELIVTIIMYIMIRKFVSLKNIIKDIWKYVVSGIVMFVPCLFIGINLTPGILNTFLLVIVGILLYFVNLLILKEKFTYYILNKIFKNKKN